MFPRITPEPAQEPAARAAHDPAYVGALARHGPGPLDPDTHMSAGSWRAALAALGCALAGVDHVLAGCGPAFCAVRPPGHHATRARAMGFCLLSTAALAALYALERVDRVAVLDFDVHHGNGTQDILWDEARAAYISTHQWPFYPSTGAEGEVGAHGQVTNIPLPAGTGSPAYRRAFLDRVLPALRAAAPGLLIVSAGFDAHADDPLGGLALTTQDFGWIGAQIGALPTLSLLEGGYNHTALAASVRAYAEGLKGGGL